MAFAFTEQQSQCLAYLREHRRAAVTGCAGSGKTLLATQFAKDLDSEGAKVLLLCRNPFLAESLRGRFQNTGVLVFAFTEFVRYLKNTALRTDVFMPRSRPAWAAPWTQYEAPTNPEINTALDCLACAAPRFDAVFVDEAQDFEASWLVVAEACLADEEDSRLVIFYDDNPLLSPFEAQCAYDGIRAPVVLSQNCRSVDEISALVKQLQPHAAEVDWQADQRGAVREWVYSSEKELFDHLRDALLAAEELSPGLKEVVVITAETNPSRMSKFSGLVIDSPRLRVAAPDGGLSWRSAVLRYLQGFGLLESDLSAAPAPTHEDIRRVNRFCAAYQAGHRLALSRQQSYSGKYSLRWYLDAFGELSLHWAQTDGLELPAVDLLKFFGSPGWTASLPQAYKRYRLAPAGQLPENPYYLDVRLVDLPSFKGLEAEGVIFVLYNYFARDNDQLLATLYLAFSRARRFLYIISPDNA